MKQILLLTVIFSMSLVSCLAQGNNSLFVIYGENAKQGFIDKDGKELIKPQFIQCSGRTRFTEGLSVVCIEGNDKAGFINEKGQFVIEPKFDDARNFSEGLAAVVFGTYGLHNQNPYKTGFIDKTGRLVIEPLFKDAMDFSEGLAAVRKDGKSGFTDKTGKIVIPLQFDYAFSFSEGLALVFVNGKYGYIDRKGNFIIKPQFTAGYNFSEGLACVKIGGQTIEPYPYSTHFGERNPKYAFINHKGEILFEFYASRASSFSDGLAAIEVENKFGFIDKSGNFVIQPMFSGAYSTPPVFSEGLARVILNNEKFGFINKKGELAIKAEFDYAENFENGLANVCEATTKSCGYLDKTGKFIWKSTK